MPVRRGFILPGILLLATLAALWRQPAFAAVPPTNPAAFTAAQWAAAFATANPLPLPQRIVLWSDLTAVHAAYVFEPLGEGPGKLPVPAPLHDFRHVDCLTYLEQVYALALSRSYTQFSTLLPHIRYKDGQIDYRWRNHYTVADWLPANAWFMHDVTESVGAGCTCTMTKTISRSAFFARKGLTQYRDIPDEQCTTCYIPRTDAAQVSSKLQTGDMVIFVIAKPGIISGHVGLIRTEHGVVYVQHASETAKKVVRVPLVDYLHHAPARFVGFKIARVNEHIVLPAR